MSKISIFVLLTGLVTGIAGIAFFLNEMNSEQSEISITSISESINSDKNISSEGITMRGDWELTVSDPDGSNPYVYNFQNTINAGAFDVISRGLLPDDHKLKGALSGYSIKIYDLYKISNGGTMYHPICEIGFSYEDVVGSFLIVEPTLNDNPASYPFYSGVTLGSSCLVKELEDVAIEGLTGDEIERVVVSAIYTVDPKGSKTMSTTRKEIFASKNWVDDPMAVVSAGQMISLNVNFTFE
jgi:hypothetical protein